MQSLINEIRKLIEFVGENGTIKKHDIDILCIKRNQLNISLKEKLLRRILQMENT